MDEPSVGQFIQKLKAVRLEESAILAQIERRLHHNAGGARRPSNEGMEDSPITCGDRKRIKNKLKRPADWNNTIEWVEERRATVTRVLEGQIHFVTDNGVRTWRAPNNVRRL